MLAIETESINLVLIYKTLFCLYLVSVLLVSLRSHKELISSDLVFLYGPAYKLFNRYQIPSLSTNGLLIIWSAFVVCLLFSAAGVATKYFLFASLILYFLYFGQFIAHEDVGRKTHLMPLMLLAFLLSPDLEKGYLETSEYWPLWLCKLFLVQFYFSAGVQKLKGTGIKWLNGDSFRKYLLAHYMWHGIEQAKWLADRPRWCSVACIGVLVFQLSIWVVLVIPQLSIFYFVVGLAFHLATAIFMRIHYLKYIGAAYLALLVDTVGVLISA